MNEKQKPQRPAIEDSERFRPQRHPSSQPSERNEPGIWLWPTAIRTEHERRRFEEAKNEVERDEEESCEHEIDEVDRRLAHDDGGQEEHKSCRHGRSPGEA